MSNARSQRNIKTELFKLYDVPPEGITELFTAIGRALWYCQCFEEALVYHICLLFDIPQGTAENIANRILEDKRRKTMGQLVREIAKKGSPVIPESLETRLYSFTDQRNWLAHRIQHENHTDLYDRESFERLLAKLTALKTEAQALTKVFEGMLDDWYRDQGLSEVELHRAMSQIIRKWKNAVDEK